MIPQLRNSVHRLTNQMQVILSFLEMEPCPLLEHCPIVDNHRKALKATKASIELLHGVVHEIDKCVVILPPEGSVIVAPHGSQIVSHDDLIKDIPHDEVQVTELEKVRKGQAENNPRTK